MGKGVWILMLAAALCVGCKRETPQSGATTNATALSSADAVISGRVVFKGNAPFPGPLPLDAVCGKLHTTPPTQRDYRVGESNGLADVFVYLKDVPAGVGATPEGEPPMLDQQGCVYTPAVFGVMVNQKFKVRNSDPLMHNVHAVPKNNKEFNF